MKGEGAIVFVIAFIIFLAATFTYADLPPGNAISDSMGIDPSLEWGGLAVKTLLSAIFNGIVYGVVVWLIFTFGKKALKK